MRSNTRLLAVLLTVMALLLAACGGGSDGDGLRVASLEDVAAAEPNSGATSADVELDADEAALALSKCLRDEGIDIPDIGVDADGQPDLRAAAQSGSVDFRSAEFRTAMDVCTELLPEGGFGGGGRAALGDNPELQDAFVAYSECIRDQGFDVGDLTFGGGPGAGDGPPADGDAPQRGQGAGQGDFGDPSTRLAEQLGLDVDDPAVAAALEVCGSVLTTAFSDAGIEARGGN